MAQNSVEFILNGKLGDFSQLILPYFWSQNVENPNAQIYVNAKYASSGTSWMKKMQKSYGYVAPVSYTHLTLPTIYSV